MKQAKKLLTALLLLCLTACSPQGGAVSSAKPYVAVIVKSTQSTFWKSVQAGANAAANEYNLHITFDGPTTEEDWQTQNEMIAQAVEDGARVIVLSAIDYTESAPAVEHAIDRGADVIIIDSDVDSDRVAARIGTNNYAAGQQAGMALLNCADERIYVGIVGFDAHSENGDRREQGLLDTIAQDPRVEIVENIDVASQSDEVQAATRDLLTRHPQINALATFNEITTLGIGHAIAELERSDTVRAIGFDNNVVSVGMLETGEIDALVVQSPFSMGYLSLETAVQLVAGRTPDETQVDTEVRVISRGDMYSKENQRFLFAFTENVG